MADGDRALERQRVGHGESEGMLWGLGKHEALDIPDVGPMVLDSVYTSTTVIVDDVGPSYSGLPSWFTPGMVLMASVFFDVDLGAVVPIEHVREGADRASLFIHCADDSTVALHHGLQMKAASANPGTELWVAKDCGHVRAFSRYPAEWESRVRVFLED